MNGAPPRRALLVFGLLAVLLSSAVAIQAQETLRPQSADESATQLPPGWQSLDRGVYDAYSTAVATGRAGRASGGLESASYKLKLQTDGSLTGEFQGKLDLTGEPAIIPLGKSSFALSNVALDGEKPIWGSDPQGITRFLCPRDGADLRFQCSQQGVRRGEAFEFSIDWLMAVATRLELTILASHSAETQGLLKTGQRKEADGSITLTYEAGARSNCTIRIHPQSDSASQPLGVELRQTLSATPTKVLLHSTVGILSTTAAPAFAEFDLPEGFTLSRATLAGEERLPLDAPRQPGPLRIPLGELAAGQRVELRLILERPAQWDTPLSIPRVAPRNGILLREELTLQIEPPLEVLNVESTGYELTALSVEREREVWTYQGTARNAALTLTVRAPTAEWSADCFVKRRQQAQRSEMVTLIDLKPQRTQLFEFDVDIAKPWKIVSVTAPDASGNPLPLTSQLLEESDRSVRHRILLRTPAVPQRGTTVTIAVAAQETQAIPSSPQLVTIPRGGRVESYVLVSSSDERSELGPPIQLSSLRSPLRTHAFFEPVRLGNSAIHRIGAKVVQSSQASAALVVEPIATAPRPAPTAPLKPLKDALAVAELQSLIGTATSSSSHRAQFIFDDPVDVSGEVIRFEGDWTLIEVLCDGAPVRAVAQGRELTLPDFPRGVTELTIRYTTAIAASTVPRRDRVDWPQTSARIEGWTWRVEATAERRVTEIDAPFEFATGIMRPGLRERLMAPLGRATGVPIFNPLRLDAWREFLNPSPSVEKLQPDAFVAAVGRNYPTATSIVSWSAALLNGLYWVLFIGGMLAASIVRRFKRGTFRFAATISAIAATAAWLLPPPFGAMAGAILGGNLLAYCIPRRLLSLRPTQVSRPAGSSIVRYAGATVLLIAAAIGPSLIAVAQIQSASANVLLLERGGESAPTVFVSEAVAKDIATWQLDQFGPPFLIRGARYDIAVDDTDLATANLEFDIAVPRPDLTRSIQLPFDGLTFRGPDAARINGELARLIPTADGSGILLALPPASAENAAKPASYRVQLGAGIRIPSGGVKREFAVAIPRCSAAVGALHSSNARFNDFRSSSRGRTEIDSGTVVCALGTIARWHVRWRTADQPDRPASEQSVSARAESVVTAEPQVLNLKTRLICETPELADPFASTRLEVILPAGSIVTSATGQSLVNWTTKSQAENLRLLLDFSSPPIVGQSVDLQYELPIPPSTLIEIPPIPLLAPGRLSSHQIALVSNPAFRMEMLTKADPDSGLWAVEPAEASFSLRKDRGLPIPVAALELEGGPAPLSLAFNRRATGRIAELEQSLNSQNDSISWTGTARLETSVRPGFLYEFRVDPAVEITSASVIERDVERLSRFVRDGDRLLLVVGDDRLGTKNVRLEGQLKLEAGKTRSVPRFDLEDTVITRREIVVTSSSDQLLQIRRKASTPLLVTGSDAEWQPQSPSSLRVSLPTSDSDFEIRWVNAASPLRLVEFLRLPDDGASACSIEWRLESNQPLPTPLAIDAPRGTHVVESSDFVEESQRPLPGDRVRIDLQARSNRSTEARIFLTAPIQATGDPNAHLPHLLDPSLQPVTYLALPQALLAQCEIRGDFLDQLPLKAPADWLRPFDSRDLLVFKLTGRDWRVSTSAERKTIGEATAEILTAESREGTHGLTRLIISPSQAAVLRIEPPPGGTLDALRASPGGLLRRNDTTWSLLLRPSQPVAIVMDWTQPSGQKSTGDASGPRTPELNVQVTYQATVSKTEATRWTPEILTRPGGAETLAAARLENLYTAARNLPIGVRPPAWLRDELQDLARTYRDSRYAGHIAVQVEGLLDSWSARMSTMTSPSAVAPESSLISRLPEQALAEQMLVAAADPDLNVETPPGRSAWSMSRRLFNGAFLSAWLIFWAFMVTKGGQWAARKQLADRLAKHPGLLVAGIGLAWWLLLSPGALGVLLTAAGILWEVNLISFRRTTRPPTATVPTN